MCLRRPGWLSLRLSSWLWRRPSLRSVHSPTRTGETLWELTFASRLPSAPALSLDCSVDLLFLLEGSSSLTLEGFLRFKSFLKRFLQTVIGSDSPSKVGLAVFGAETRLEVQVGKFRRNLGGFLRAVDALQSPGGQTLTGQALRHATRHGFVSAPAFADVTDDLPRVVVLLTANPAADEVIEASKYARDREIFLIGVGPDFLKGQLNNMTGNPQRTLTYSSPDRLSEKLPELKAKICSVDTQGNTSKWVFIHPEILKRIA